MLSSGYVGVVLCRILTKVALSVIFFMVALFLIMDTRFRNYDDTRAGRWLQHLKI